MPRQFTVTSTIKATSITTTFYNPATKQLETKVINLKKFDNEWAPEKIIKVLRTEEFNAVDFENITEVSALYGMTDDDFYAISETISPDDRRGLITRTMKNYCPSCTVFDMAHPEKGMYHMSAGFAPIEVKDWKEEKKLAYVRKMVETDTLKVLQLLEGTISEDLRGTTVEKFIAKAVELDPNTRQPITENQEG